MMAGAVQPRAAAESLPRLRVRQEGRLGRFDAFRQEFNEPPQSCGHQVKCPDGVSRTLVASVSCEKARIHPLTDLHWFAIVQSQWDCQDQMQFDQSNGSGSRMCRLRRAVRASDRVAICRQ